MANVTNAVNTFTCSMKRVTFLAVMRRSDGVVLAHDSDATTSKNHLATLRVCVSCLKTRDRCTVSNEWRRNVVETRKQWRRQGGNPLPRTRYDCVQWFGVKLAGVFPWAQVTLQDDTGFIYMQFDDADRVYVACTTQEYPARLIFSQAGLLESEFLCAVARRFHWLQKTGAYACSAATAVCGRRHQVAARHYGNVRHAQTAPVLLETNEGGRMTGGRFNDFDSIARVQTQVNTVMDTAAKNISSMLERSANLKLLEDSSMQLVGEAERFGNEADLLRRRMRCRNCKVRQWVCIS